MPKASRGPALATFSGFELIKQYPAEEQVRLKVIVDIPGSWFGAGHLGALNASERSTKYTAQAVESSAAHPFGSGKSRSVEKAIRFVCMSDAVDDPKSRIMRASG